MLAGEAEEAVLDVLGQRTLDQSLRELLALKNKAHTRSDRETRAVVRAKH
jgi:alkylhydroperoxidase/carboxymuconolactone decarboxylase family protein YurZ